MARRSLTSLDELGNEDGNLDDGEDVDDDGDLLPVGPQHAQLTEAQATALVIGGAPPGRRIGIVHVVGGLVEVAGGLVLVPERDLVCADGRTVGRAGPVIARVLGEALLTVAYTVGGGMGLRGIDMVVEDGLEGRGRGGADMAGVWVARALAQALLTLLMVGLLGRIGGWRVRRGRDRGFVLVPVIARRGRSVVVVVCGHDDGLFLASSYVSDPSRSYQVQPAVVTIVTMMAKMTTKMEIANDGRAEMTKRE